MTLAGDVLVHGFAPKYLGVTLDRSLTYRKHTENVRDKVKSHYNIISKLAGTDWGAQARIQLLAKGEVVKIMENNVFLPQVANVSDRMPGTKTSSATSSYMSFSGYTIGSECTSWEHIGGMCKPGSWGSNHIFNNIMASKRAKLRGLLS